MMVSNEFVNRLKVFGLNSYEAKLWVALLSRGTSTAGELSDISNVPRSRAYDVLESLEKKGFIVTKVGKPIKYLAISPDEVLSRVKKDITRDADTKTGMLDKVKGSDVMDELQLLYSQGIDFVSPNDLTGSFKGQQSIMQQMDFMIKSAEDNITIVTTESGLNAISLYLFRPFRKAIDRGVSIRIAAPLTHMNQKAFDTLTQVADIRNMPDIKYKYSMVDGKEMLFMLTGDDTLHPDFEVGIWMNTEFFTKALQDLFEIKWNSAEIIAKSIN
jgi:HTH-type transcriptional regulator, sugar sensing transcriptional regulator